jgi:hypothetical protein
MQLCDRNCPVFYHAAKRGIAIILRYTQLLHGGSDEAKSSKRAARLLQLKRNTD